MIPAGQLNRRLTFQRRAPLPQGDGAGNFEEAWGDRFTVWARVRPKLGGEEVTAGRLAGVQPVTIVVRRTRLSCQITADWRAVDTRGTVYAITSPAVDIAEDGACLEMMASTGRAP